MATEGTFVLADIGGYTQFLTGVGIEHAKEITSDLFNAMLKCNRERWKIANIEGDCIFFYRPGREEPGELLDHVRALYEVFCGRVIDIAARATCPCGACSRTNQLTLKFIVHAGQFDTQKIGNRQELIGPDVVVAHRLLKNSVPVSEYMLLTRAYSGGGSPGALPAQAGRDEFGDVGTVEYDYYDLQPVRAEVQARRSFFVSEDEARLVISADIQAPPELAWRTMNDREKRAHVLGHKDITETPSPFGGRLGEVHRCIHGDNATRIEVMIAFDDEGHRLTMRTFPSPLVKDVYFTLGMDPLPGGGSHVYFHLKFQEAIPGVSHLMRPLMLSMIRKIMRGSLERLKQMCEADVSAQQPRILPG